MDDARQLSVPTIPRMISIGPKLLDYGDSHSTEQQYPLILRSLHDQRQEIPLPSRLKLARMYYSAMTAQMGAFSRSEGVPFGFKPVIRQSKVRIQPRHPRLCLIERFTDE
jgi:hypothetical protein